MPSLRIDLFAAFIILSNRFECWMFIIADQNVSDFVVTSRIITFHDAQNEIRQSYKQMDSRNIYIVKTPSFQRSEHF